MRTPALPVAVFALVVGAGDAAADFARIKQSGTLRVVVMPDTRRPEFFSLKPGTPPGFDHEVLEGFAALHKLKLRVVPVSGWDALIPALLDGKGDVIAGRFSDTPTRRKQIAFTSEVFPTRHVVITRKPHRVVETLDQLRAERLGTFKGSSMVETIAAAGVPAANVDDEIPPGSFGEHLKSGRITAAVWGVESAIALQREDREVQLGLFLGPPASLAFGVPKGSPGLLAALNQYIESLRKTASWSRLVVKYFGEAAPEVLKKARAQ